MPLSNRQAWELIKQYQAGNRDSIDELVRQYTDLISSIARRYRSPQLEFDELFQEGVIGLMRAARTYDPAAAAGFVTHAQINIRSCIARFVELRVHTVHLPTNIICYRNRIRKAIQAAENAAGRTLTDRELTERLNINEEELLRYRLLEARGSTVSLDNLVTEDHRGIDVVAGDTKETPVNHVLKRDRTETIKYLLNTLKPRERQVIILHFGLFGEEPHTLRAISRVIGTSGETARRVRNRALFKLKAASVIGRHSLET